MTTTICQAAIALAGISITLQLAAALARSSAPEPITPTEEKSPHHASLRLTHRELRALAQQLQVGTSKFRSHAKKTELIEVFRAHNMSRRAA